MIPRLNRPLHQTHTLCRRIPDRKRAHKTSPIQVKKDHPKLKETEEGKKERKQSLEEEAEQNRS